VVVMHVGHVRVCVGQCVVRPTDDCVDVRALGVRMPRRSLCGGYVRIFATVGVYRHARCTNRSPLGIQLRGQRGEG